MSQPLRGLLRSANSFFHQRHDCQKASHFVTALLAMSSLSVFTPVSADSVSAIFSHGSLEAVDVPSSYGVLDSVLFFSAGDRLYRLNSVNDAPESLALPAEVGSGLALRATFSEFDGALFMHARRRSPGANGTFLHRFRNRAGKFDLIDIDEEPATNEFSWILERGYADDSRGFAELDGKLYFFAARAIPPLDFINHSHALYRLDNATAHPEQVLWADYFNAVNPRDLAATAMGLVFRATSPGVARQGHPPQSYVYRIDDPQLLRNAPDPYQDFSVATAKRITGRTGGRELIVFDNMIYYSGEHHGLNVGAGRPGDTILPDPGRIKNVADPVQTELYRHDPSSGNGYFDLHAVSSDTAASAQANGESIIGSSSPDSFVTAHGAFYFRARSDGIHADLFRMQSGDLSPKPLVLNQDGPAHARPLGEFLGKLWLVADIGSGVDLHYLDQHESTPTPLNVSESVARSARGFTVFDDHVVFSAKNESGEWWTYAARHDGNVSHITDEKLATTLMANGLDTATAETIPVDVNARVLLSCQVTNMSTRRIDNVRVAIRPLNRYRRPTQTSANGETDDTNKFNRFLTQDNHSICRSERLLSGRTVNCRLVLQAKAGRNRYACISSSINGTDTLARRSIRTVIDGTESGKKR